MNVERLTKIAEWLEGGAKHERLVFDMSKGIELIIREEEFFDPDKAATCGASCCIAGAAVEFFGDVQSIADRSGLDWFDTELRFYGLGGVREGARELLELDDDQAEDLFEPWLRGGRDMLRYNDPAWAARTIRHLITTGTVDWEAAVNADSLFEETE